MSFLSLPSARDSSCEYGATVHMEFAQSSQIDFFFFFFSFFAVPGIEHRGVLPPRYTPGPIFILYFETGSHEVAEGLTK